VSGLQLQLGLHFNRWRPPELPMPIAAWAGSKASRGLINFQTS
jgi:hypothetical protein